MTYRFNTDPASKHKNTLNQAINLIKHLTNLIAHDAPHQLEIAEVKAMLTNGTQNQLTASEINSLTQQMQRYIALLRLKTKVEGIVNHISAYSPHAPQKYLALQELSTDFHQALDVLLTNPIFLYKHWQQKITCATHMSTVDGIKRLCELKDEIRLFSQTETLLRTGLYLRIYQLAKAIMLTSPNHHQGLKALACIDRVDIEADIMVDTRGAYTQFFHSRPDDRQLAAIVRQDYDAFGELFIAAIKALSVQCSELEYLEALPMHYRTLEQHFKANPSASNFQIDANDYLRSDYVLYRNALIEYTAKLISLIREQSVDSQLSPEEYYQGIKQSGVFDEIHRQTQLNIQMCIAARHRLHYYSFS